MDNHIKTRIAGYTNDDILRYLLADMDWEETQVFEQKLSVSDDLQQQVDFLKTKLNTAIDNIASTTNTPIPNAAVQHTIDTVFNQPLSIIEFIYLAWQGIGAKIAVAAFVFLLAGGGVYLHQNNAKAENIPNILEIFEYNGLTDEAYLADINTKHYKNALNYLQENQKDFKGDILALTVSENTQVMPETEFNQKIEDIEKTDTKYTTAEEILVIKIGYYQKKDKSRVKEYCHKLLNMPDINPKYKIKATEILEKTR